MRLSSYKFQKPIQFFQMYKKYIPVISFTGGFLWDSLTLTRIDRMSDNLILLGYLILLGFFIILINLVEKQQITKPILLKYSEWYPIVIQFFLGGLFSSYVVFYFQSSALTKNWLFLGILILLLIGNEFLEKRLTNLYLQMILYFLVTFSFFIFFLPVMTKHMNVFIFILSGLLSLLMFALILYLLYKKFTIIQKSKMIRISAIVLILYLVVNLLYSLNWIPPVPLSLKAGGIYHHVHRAEDKYVLKIEHPKWYQFWKDSDNPFHYQHGDSVFCFAAIFAPTQLTKTIYHHWQRYDENQNIWLTTDKLGYQVFGGRRGGYRGYTFKRNVKPGKWRVDVKTDEDQILGRIGFKIQKVDSLIKPLKTVLK